MGKRAKRHGRVSATRTINSQQQYQKRTRPKQHEIKIIIIRCEHLRFHISLSTWMIFNCVFVVHFLYSVMIALRDRVHRGCRLLISLSLSSFLLSLYYLSLSLHGLLTIAHQMSLHVWLNTLPAKPFE